MTMPHAENTLFRFEVQAEEGTHVVDAFVNTASLANAIKDPKSFDKMTQALCDGFGLEFRDALDRRTLIGLPLVQGHPLSGRWTCSSPMGMEGTQPVPAWEFVARVNQALVNPELFPLLQGDITSPEDMGNDQERPVAEYCAKVREVMEAQFGKEAVVKVEVQQVQTWIDQALGGMSF